jgi:acyl carrier protein
MAFSTVQDDIRRFISRTFLFEFGTEVRDDTDLFDTGLIDSYGFIELVKFLEQTYGIGLSVDDLASPEMATLQGITRLVADRQISNYADVQRVP